MTPDYYAVLGVATNADRETIWRAFRRRAAQRHPDCGGSHREMCLLNEAWNILSDASARARYDKSRRHASSLAVRQAFEQDQQQARAQAEQYPRRWGEFERWLDRLANDVNAAQFETQEGVMGIPFPVASGSLSAAVLICTGAAIGAAVSIWLNWIIGLGDVFFYLMSAAIVGTGGAWLGYYLHDLFRRMVVDQVRSTTAGAAAQGPGDETATVVIISCQSCGQRLRFPRLKSALHATCPRCREQFELPPAA